MNRDFQPVKGLFFWNFITILLFTLTAKLALNMSILARPISKDDRELAITISELERYIGS